MSKKTVINNEHNSSYINNSYINSSYINNSYINSTCPAIS